MTISASETARYAKYGILSAAVPDLAGNSGEALAQQPHAVRPGTPRRCRHDRTAASLDGSRDAVGNRGENFLIHPIGAVGAADQHADDRARQRFKRRKAAAFGGKTRRHNAMHGARRDQHARAAQTVVLRHDDQIKAVPTESRVLDVHRDRPSAACALDRQRRAHGVAAATDDGIRPGRQNTLPRLRHAPQRRDP